MRPGLVGSWEWPLGFFLLLWCDAAVWVGAEEGYAMTEFKQDHSLSLLC